MSTWLIRDDDAQNGTTWVKSYRFERDVSCIDGKAFDRDVEAEWTASGAEAHRFASELEARLLAMQVGGRACIRWEKS